MKIYMEKKERETNIELLRIVSMVLVMVVHADFKALGIPSQVEIVECPVSSFMRFFTESISIVCVNLFVLISGWFGIRFKMLRLGELLFQILFFCVIMFIILVCCGEICMSNCKIFVNDSIENYWFVWAYLILYLFAPALNCYINNATKKELELFLTLFFIFQTIFGYVILLSWFSKGYSPLSFMGLYVLGRYLHLYPNKITTQKQSVYVLVYLSMVLLTTCMTFFSSVIRMDPYKVYSYSSPIVIVGSTSLFLFFTKFSFRSKIVNWIAISCFSIYLVHCFPIIFEKVYLYQIKECFDSMNTPSFILRSFLWIVLFMVISVFLDKIRIFLWLKMRSLFVIH